MSKYTYAQERREALDLLFRPSQTLAELLATIRALEREYRCVPYWWSL